MERDNHLAINYVIPNSWMKYDISAVAKDLIEAKANILALTTTPFQRNWVEGLQEIQLKREVAGTSRIEGADFTEGELEVALRQNATPEELKTRSQRQAHSAVTTYRWIASLQDDHPIDASLIKEVHRRIVTNCDDDHCAPGVIHGADCNVTFGIPKHRGCDGGKMCIKAFDDLVTAINHEFRGHDPLIQALALHYHFAAMHPFLDGNGRTARALEALMLQRADVTDRAFIAMSNYYYDEKDTYLRTLSQVREKNHDLTPFLIFGLRGITLQSGRLYSEIRRNMQVVLFKNMMYELFNRLDSPRKRVIKERQIELLKFLLEVETMDWHDLRRKMEPYYTKVANFQRTIVRDVGGLIHLGAVAVNETSKGKYSMSARLQWPQEITESDFFTKVNMLPKGKTHSFLR